MTELLFRRSGRLFANPSFAEGISRIFDILGNHDTYNVDPTSGEADSKALYSDWAAVGDHLIIAAKKLSSDGG